MSIDLLHREARHGSLVDFETTKEQAKELAIQDVASLFSGNRYIEDELVLESLWWATSDEGLGPDGLKQYFSLSKVEGPNPSGKFTGESPDKEQLLTQLVIIYDKWQKIKSHKDMDGVRGKLVAIPNDYIAARMPDLSGSTRDRSRIGNSPEPIRGWKIDIDKETLDSITGRLPVGPGADLSTPGIINRTNSHSKVNVVYAGPDRVYDKLKRSRPEYGGAGNYELKMVITSPLDKEQITTDNDNDRVGIDVAIALLFDEEARKMLYREKDNGIHRMLPMEPGDDYGLGINIVGKGLTIRKWSPDRDMNRYKFMSAIDANPSEVFGVGAARRFIGGVAVGVKRPRNREQPTEKDDSIRKEYWDKQNSRRDKYHKERLGRVASVGSVLR